MVLNDIPMLLHWQLQQSCKPQEAASIAGISGRAAYSSASALLEGPLPLKMGASPNGTKYLVLVNEFYILTNM